MRSVELAQWNEFKMRLLELMIRLRAGDTRLSADDVETIKTADFYLHVVDEMADVPDIVRIYREKITP